jgi:hypothetical protein
MSNRRCVESETARAWKSHNAGCQRQAIKMFCLTTYCIKERRDGGRMAAGCLRAAGAERDALKRPPPPPLSFYFCATWGILPQRAHRKTHTRAL